MRADRMSSYEQWSLNLNEALLNEAVGGEKTRTEEAQAGAARFAAGKGRGGDFKSI
jgi:enoyl-CoA hydratase